MIIQSCNKLVTQRIEQQPLTRFFNILSPTKGNVTEDDNPTVDLTCPNNLSRSGILWRYPRVIGPSPQFWMKASTTSSLSLMASMSLSG